MEKGTAGAAWGKALGFQHPTELSSHPSFMCNSHNIISPLWGSVVSSTNCSLAWRVWKELKDELKIQQSSYFLNSYYCIIHYKGSQLVLPQVSMST